MNYNLIKQDQQKCSLKPNQSKSMDSIHPIFAIQQRSMNLVNSKVIKSSRPVINRSIETVTAYSCQLFIQSFKISHRGYVYFLWTSNNSQINSLRYESTGRLIQVKETLTISLRIASKNGRDLPSVTCLKLMAEEGEELDEFEIPMNNLTGQFKEMEIPMDRGLINIKVRRKVMNIGQEEEINFQGGFYRSMAMRGDEKSMANMVSGQYQSLQEELSRIKKQLEDAVYLNNKLKNDRDVLLATKQQLELQIQTMIIQITKEISVLRQHYDNRMSIRQHCYEEEIEDLVNHFNSDTEQTKKTVEMILKQKIKLEEEMKPLSEKLKNIESEINQKNVDFARLSEEKIQLEIKLSQTEETVLSRQREIETLSHAKDGIQQEMNSQNLQIEHLNGQISGKNESIMNLKEVIAELQKKIVEGQSALHGKDQHIFQLQGRILQLEERQKAHENQKELYRKQVNLLEEEKKGLHEKIEEMNAKFEEFQYQMEFNENVMGQLKKQQAQKEQELYSQLEALQKIYSQKMEDILNNFQHEKDELIFLNHALQQEKIQHQQKIHELEDNVKGSELKLNQMDNQLNNLSNVMRATKGSAEEKDEIIKNLMRELQKLNEQNQNFKTTMMKAVQKKESQINGEPPKSNQEKTNLNNELISKNQELEAEIKRLTGLLQKSQKQADKIKEQKQILEEQSNKKIQQEKNQKQSKLKNSKKQSQHEVDSLFKNGPVKQEQVAEIVNAKQRQISELRHRVDYLENLYQGLHLKFQEIAKKYPHIDLGSLQVPKHQEWCDSEMEQQKILNQGLQNGSLPEAANIKQAKRISRRESIGAAIMEKDEDALSDPSVKLTEGRKSMEPRSEKKISEGSRKGIIRKQSAIMGRVTIEVPGDLSMRKQASNGSYEPSQKGSYIKVSHAKKIKQLEDQVKLLSDQVKQYETQIADYTKKNDTLKKELESKAGHHHQAAGHETRKENKQSQVFIEDERVKNFMHQSQIKEFQIQKMNLRVGQLEDNLKIQRADAQKKISTLEIKLSEYERIRQQSGRKLEGLNEIIKSLQKLNEQLQQRIRKQKETAQQTRLTVKELQMHLDNAQNELKRLKSQNQTLEEKVQKLIGSEAVIKQLSRQLDDYNKKGLDQTRVINHLKLEKDAIEEELRLLKKRQNDHIRISTEWEEKAASLERALEQQKRKEGKLKREIDQAQQQLRRSKLSTKKVEEQLQSLNSSQIAWQGERRKHLDEISNLQDQLSRKDYEYAKLNKEVQKWKARAEQKQEQRMGKKSELREQIDRLESQLIRKEKKILEETEQNKLLRGRLQLLQRQNKRIMEQKNQSYGQKLRYYVEQMSSIKKLLEEYQNQNSRLKIDNNQLYEQLEILRINYDKLQMKYDENIQRQQSILNDLQAYINQVNILKDRLAQAHGELDQAESAFVSIRKQADEQKLQSRKTAQRLQTSERNLQRAMIEIRDLKVKISESETSNEINGKMGERYRALQRKKAELEEQYKKIKAEYDNIINIFVYKREDLEKAVSEARAHERRLKDQQIQKISEQCSRTITSKTQRLQQEILDVYNQNSRLRSQNQILIEENGRMKGKIIQMEIIVERYGGLQADNDNYRSSMEEIKEELRKRNEKISKIQISLQAVEAECNNKQRDLISAKSRIQQLQRTIEKLSNQISARKVAEKELQDALLKVGQSKQREKSEQQFQFRQKQAQLKQQYQSKILAMELQIQRLKQKEGRSIEENASKMKKLEQKMDEMQQALKQRQKAIATNYETDMQQLESSLLRLSQQLEEKLIRIDELNQGILILQDQNKDLTKELQDVKYQFEQERQILDGQLNRLKNKLKEAETTYAANLKSLQQQVLRNAQKANITGSRVKTSEGEDRIAKRYEQKLKTKDRKIEELKQNIYTLEETIVKLRKKQSGYQSTLSELEKLKISIVQFQKERKNIQNKYQEELNRNAETIRELKRQILLTKESQERLRLLSEQKVFENESISCQLKTMRELYQQLQRELQKRKNNLTAQLEQESSIQLELRTREGKILELEEKLMQSLKYNKEFEADIKRKSIQIKKYIEMISQLQKKQQKYVEDIGKLTTQLALAKKNSQELASASQLSKAEVVKMRNELTRLRKSQEQLRATCTSKEEAATQLKRICDDLSNRYRESQELSQKYIIINEKSREQLGCGIEDLIDRFMMHLEEKDAEINQLIQEVQQLKFLNERKYLDYDELKKENFELQIKVEDLDILNDQLETLRKICDKLQEEKKNSVFRQEVLRMQLENLANGGAPDLRSRIEAILSNQAAPSYSNFSFYNM